MVKKNTNFCYPCVVNAPNWRGSPLNFVMTIGLKKTRMTGLPNGGEVWRYVHSFSYNITTWQMDRQMDKNATTILPCHTDMWQTWYSIRQPHNAIAVCGKFIKKKKQQIEAKQWHEKNQFYSFHTVFENFAKQSNHGNNRSVPFPLNRALVQLHRCQNTPYAGYHHHHHRDICNMPITVFKKHKHYICYSKIDKKRLWLGLINIIC